MSVKDSVLKALEAGKGGFISGEALSDSLGVSRTAVWKAIKLLREEGYPIESSTNRGYMLMQSSWLITEESLRTYLPAPYKGNDIYIYDSLESTNLEAKQTALEGGAHGTVVMARRQTKGRGRLGRSFFSPDEGIYISVILRPALDISKSLPATLAAAVAVAESIEEVCGKEALIKWVNDIYVDGKKVCGILTEGITDFETGSVDSLITGIGINTTVKDFPEELLDTVGAVTGSYSKSALAASVISKLLDFTEDLDNRAFMKAYREKCLVLGKTVNVYRGAYKVDPQKESKGVPARVLDITDDGGLVVLYSNGSQEVLTTGEISIRLK
ncbi:MAG TPA: biotin--[acetyl-CoA-carboxylase] ligase [Candidatus Copromorpha excrementigallinarum]|uniref:Bifunctional ligase/repressor BirA n=1 Tax=Candidatus Allocopromorpha excrementigallinarum TaxID=2840742 RepID=A0A9D1I1Q8_9FIRM|nr:biotin--[acetyl-CoA-carboxylase] ligase [Candidatus Copromorpha excrementigallinarum]